MSQIRRRMAETMNYEQCTTKYAIRDTQYSPTVICPPPLYICREPSTKQLLFMQNKPNFRKAKMNVNSLITMNYENKSNWTIGQSKPNSNPISSNAKMNANSFIIKDYRKKDDFAVQKSKPNSNPMGFQIPSINSKDRHVICNGKYRLDVPGFAGKQADVIIFPENGQYSFTAFFA